MSILTAAPPYIPDTRALSIGTTDLTHPNAANWDLIVAPFVNAGGGDQSNRPNVTYGFGYNVGPSFPLPLATESGLYWSMESFYNPTPGAVFKELHLLYEHPDGYNARVFSLALHEGASPHFIDSKWIVDKMTFARQSDNATWMQMQPGVIRLQAMAGQSATVLLGEQNNVPFIEQLNAAGKAYVYALSVTDLDRVTLANHFLDVSSTASDLAEGETALLVATKLKGVVSTKRVTVDQETGVLRVAVPTLPTASATPNVASGSHICANCGQPQAVVGTSPEGFSMWRCVNPTCYLSK